MSANMRQAYELMGETYPEPEEAPQRVNFSLERGGIKVSASVTASYFDAHVLPVIDKLLEEIAAASPSETAAHEPQAEQPEFRRKEPLSVRMVIEALGAHSGPELLRAAAVSLAVVQDVPTFSRHDLLAEAEKAVGHWRKSHSKSIESILNYLIASGTLVERGDGQLCLSHAEEKAAIVALRASA